MEPVLFPAALVPVFLFVDFVPHCAGLSDNVPVLPGGKKGGISDAALPDLVALRGDFSIFRLSAQLKKSPFLGGRSY